MDLIFFHHGKNILNRTFVQPHLRIFFRNFKHNIGPISTVLKILNGIVATQHNQIVSF